jgi:signal recognition particle subunit SEC65
MKEQLEKLIKEMETVAGNWSGDYSGYREEQAHMEEVSICCKVERSKIYPRDCWKCGALFIGVKKEPLQTWFQREMPKTRDFIRKLLSKSN